MIDTEQEGGGLMDSGIFRFCYGFAYGFQGFIEFSYGFAYGFVRGSV